MKNDFAIVDCSEIRTARTVTEFRENLRKYVFISPGDTLYVKKPKGVYDFVPLSSINSFSDFYDKKNLGYQFLLKVILNALGRRDPVSAPPSLDKVCQRYTVFESKLPLFSIPKKYRNKFCWWTPENRIMRPLYIKMFGDFCNY